ncbi:MAG TPA: GDSL-type esterase/lipase family protein [Vicinamibacterales bacterium]|nr:GDSL-type esterase/lipase family protein [Vicinamibacterales bacterium]
MDAARIRATIVALGDSTTAGTPGFTSPIEAPPNGSGNVESQYAYWLMKMSMVGSRESVVGSHRQSEVSNQPEVGRRFATTGYRLPGLSTTDFRLQTVPSFSNWLVLNRGVNGERTDQIRARFERDVLAAKPNAVIVIAGVNDVCQGRGADGVIGELEAMYDIGRAAGIPVVGGTILPFDTATPDQNARMRTVNDWIRGHASRMRAMAFCDTRAAVASPDAPDRLVSSPDNLHPSPEGYRLMAIALEPAVKRALASAMGKA